jgi:hypothetical protein
LSALSLLVGVAALAQRLLVGAVVGALVDLELELDFL